MYNDSYESLPSYPRSYSNNTNLGITMSKYSDLVVDGKNKCFYINYNPFSLKVERKNNYTINGVEFNNFSEKLDILDYTNGIILKIDFNISNENIQSIGCDLNFDINFNGDDFCIPYNVYYTSVLY